jgi:hypothetical protein
MQKYFNLNYRVDAVPRHKLPWMWIGGEKNNISRNFTAVVNQNVIYGVVIDAKFLTEVTGYTADRWLYLDSRTLHEHEIPPAGFIITR